MAALRLPLRLARTSAGTMPWAAVRELTGADELAVEGVGTRAALALLTRLVTLDDPAAVSALSASDRDLLLAALYRLTYGERVQSTIRCKECSTSFDMDFSLRELARRLAATQAEAIGSIGADGVVVTRQGGSLRVPNACDEVAAGDLPRAQALQRLEQATAAGCEPAADCAAVLERVAPIFDLELDARCPECEHTQPVSFDLQSFLLRSLVNEQRQLHADVHALAANYGWPLQEILALTRRRRRAFVATLDEVNRRSQEARRRSMR